MKKLLPLLILAILILFPRCAWGDDACPDGKVCVDKDDWKTVTTVLQEKKCLVSTEPTVKTDPITVVVDRQGRIYGSGSNPNPFKVQLHWCNYDVTAAGQTSIVAAEHVDPEWGFRFRPKAAIGMLPGELLWGKKVVDSIDAGAMLEPFYWRFLNVNGYVGLRSFGGALGISATKNLDVHVGYALTYADLHSGIFVGIGFALW